MTARSEATNALNIGIALGPVGDTFGLAAINHLANDQYVEGDLVWSPETIEPQGVEDRRPKLPGPFGKRVVLDLRGVRYGNRVALVRHLVPSPAGGTRWWTLCDCGRLATVRASDLRKGHVDRCKSCGQSGTTRTRKPVEADERPVEDIDAESVGDDLGDDQGDAQGLYSVDVFEIEARRYKAYVDAGVIDKADVLAMLRSDAA